MKTDNFEILSAFRCETRGPFFNPEQQEQSTVDEGCGGQGLCFRGGS